MVAAEACSRGCRYLAGALLVVGCGAPPRPQGVVAIDFDMPVAGLGPSEGVNASAAVDTLRIEILDASRAFVDQRVFPITSPEALPLSFGVPSEAIGGAGLVRVRAFAAALGSLGDAHGEPVIDPRPEVTVDRLIALEGLDEEVATRSATLHGDCIGTPVRFGLGDGDVTCVDAQAPAAPPRTGVGEAPSASVSGSWERARVRPCAAAAPAGTRCVPGGLAIIGDEAIGGGGDGELDAVPLRVVELAPFFMDRTEVRVGEVRALLGAGYDGPLPIGRDPSDEALRHCTWSVSARDDMPVNCVTVAAAEAICAARGGALPTEAQWEYAARSRSERRRHTWGDELPDCCLTSMERFEGGCGGAGPEPVASHLALLACAGDVSVDGIFDLNGSVAELVRDAAAGFDAPCWAAPGPGRLLADPWCDQPGPRAARGAASSMSFAEAGVAERRLFIEADPSYGFRCVY